MHNNNASKNQDSEPHSSFYLFSVVFYLPVFSDGVKILSKLLMEQNEYLKMGEKGGWLQLIFRCGRSFFHRCLL